jgi:hypothetical protein
MIFLVWQKAIVGETIFFPSGWTEHPSGYTEHSNPQELLNKLSDSGYQIVETSNHRQIGAKNKNNFFLLFEPLKKFNF